MGNAFTGGGQRLKLSNGATEVLVEVLMLAVSELAEEAWDYRFAALLTLQDQNVVGRGTVGFELEGIDWGATPGSRARSKDFVLRTTALALSGHRWDGQGYNTLLARNFLQRFEDMVRAFEPGPGRPAGRGVVFPRPDEAATASCVRHRILSGLPFWDECVFCTRSF